MELTLSPQVQQAALTSWPRGYPVVPCALTGAVLAMASTPSDTRVRS